MGQAPVAAKCSREAGKFGISVWIAVLNSDIDCPSRTGAVY